MVDISKPADDKTSRVDKLTQVLLMGLYMGNEQPYPLAPPAARKVAELMDDLGARVSGEVVTEVTLPTMVTERLQETVEPSPTVDHHAIQEDSPLVGVAPEQPAHIPAHLLGVVR